MNAVIELIRASGYVEDAEGKTYQAKASAVSFDAGGHVAFDEIWMPGVRKAASFVSRERRALTAK
jgi:hypothetical protein